MIIQVIGAFLGIISVSVIYGIDRKFMVYCGADGAIGWLVYLMVGRYTDSESIKAFIATLCVAMIAHVFARVIKAPVTIFLIPGILPLVPGIGMYRSVYHFMIEDGLASHYMIETIKTAGAIAMAIFTMDTLFRLYPQISFKKREERQK